MIIFIYNTTLLVSLMFLIKMCRTQNNCFVIFADVRSYAQLESMDLSAKMSANVKMEENVTLYLVNAPALRDGR